MYDGTTRELEQLEQLIWADPTTVTPKQIGDAVVDAFLESDRLDRAYWCDRLFDAHAEALAACDEAVPDWVSSGQLTPESAGCLRDGKVEWIRVRKDGKWVRPEDAQ